jgi:hypothetical protein
MISGIVCSNSLLFSNFSTYLRQGIPALKKTKATIHLTVHSALWRMPFPLLANPMALEFEHGHSTGIPDPLFHNNVLHHPFPRMIVPHHNFHSTSSAVV